MQIYRITQGNTLPELRMACGEEVDLGTGVVVDPTPVDITGATCVLVATSPSSIKTEFAMTVADGPNGIASKFFTAAESDALEVGQYQLFVRVTWPGNPPTVETFPDLERGAAMVVLEKQ